MAGNAHIGSDSNSGRELLLRKYDPDGNELWTWQSGRPIEFIAASGAVASDDTGVYLLEPNLDHAATRGSAEVRRARPATLEPGRIVCRVSQRGRHRPLSDRPRPGLPDDPPEEIQSCRRPAVDADPQERCARLLRGELRWRLHDHGPVLVC